MPTTSVPTAEIRDVLHRDLLALADLPDDGEPVDQLAHALQAATLAVADGAGPVLVAAALLHDVGRLAHVAAALPGAPHERAGAVYVTRHVGAEAGWLVGAHVMAKRALVATDPGYRATLSPTSVRTLAEQGGPAADAELARFLRHPRAGNAMRVRRWDDLAKDPAARTLTPEQALDAALGQRPC
ncbi:hypothetical protein [Pseudonocardia sp. H11422]|uniref:hypothetical protein n=1 Tax=Pseudonocardia sp. H11422 TaxID=2835866 RepID=UPI001BDC7C75|nr:hypothetical protein [Pseudonocardia sp. H11422]